MSREIKFRAWDTKDHKWLFGRDGFSMFGEMVIMGEWGNAAWRSISDDEADRYVLCQFTGLKDKNGVEIYEGDVVAISLYTNRGDFELESGVIKWSESSAAFKWYSIQDDPSDDNNYWLTDQDASYREVIGNIYEHPHLLDPKTQ